MGWGSGSSLAEAVWQAVRFKIPAGEARMIAARKIIYEFEQHDCDTIPEAEDLCADAGYVYDEGRDEHVYTSLPSDVRCNSLCEIGVPCCECPKAPQQFLYVTSAAASADKPIPEREQWLAMARSAATPNFRVECMVKADNAKTDVCRDCQFRDRGVCDLCVRDQGRRPAKLATFAREPAPASVNEAAVSRELDRERALDAAVERCRACPHKDCRNCDDTPTVSITVSVDEREGPIDWKHPPRRVETVGEELAAEVLRRAINVKPASAAEIMREAGVPNMLEGRTLNLRITPDPCQGCTKNGPNGCSSCHVCEHGGP